MEHFGRSGAVHRSTPDQHAPRRGARHIQARFVNGHTPVTTDERAELTGHLHAIYRPTASRNEPRAGLTWL